MVTHTPRTTPAGVAFDEGYQSFIAFAADDDLEFWETAVGAPGLDGGEPIPTTTHHNSALKTKAPQSLIELTPFQVTGRFNSATVDKVRALINVNGWITITWPDLTEFSFLGYLRGFQPSQATVGAPLEGTITIEPTSQEAGVETDYQVAEQGTGS